MKTREVRFDGDLQLVIPDDDRFTWPAGSVLEFPFCCGPEKWNTKFYIFDKLFGVRISPACFVHDVMWEICDATWGDFHYSNSVFLHNVLNIVNMRSEVGFLRFLRRHKAFAYYDAIDIGGAKHFWEYKASQGFDISEQKRGKNHGKGTSHS